MGNGSSTSQRQYDDNNRSTSRKLKSPSDHHHHHHHHRRGNGGGGEDGGESLSQTIHPGVPRTELLTCETSAQKLLSLINDDDVHSEFIPIQRLLKRVISTVEDISKNNRYKSLFKRGETSEPSKEFAKLLCGLNQVLINLYNLMNDHLEDSMTASNQHMASSSTAAAAAASSSYMGGLTSSSSPAAASSSTADAYNGLYYLIKEECNIILEHQYDQFKLYRKYLTDSKNHQQTMKTVNPEDLSMEDFLKMANQKDFDVASYFGSDMDAKIFWARYYGPTVFSCKKDEFLKHFRAQLVDMQQRKLKRRLSYRKDKSASDTESKKDGELKEIVWIPEFEILVDPTCDGYVSVSDFRSFLGWFGPMDDCCRNAEALLTSPWFWGSLSSLDSQALLDREETGTFLVRFNDTRPGSFYITCVEEQTDENGFNGNGGGQMTYLGEQEIQQAIHFKVNKEKEKYFWLSGSDKGHKTIDSLLAQYELTFKHPFTDAKLKYKAITDFRIRDEDEDDDDAMGFYGFLRKTAARGLNRPLVLADLNFATFRGRIPDIPFVPREDPNRKRRMDKKKSVIAKRKITARKSAHSDINEEIAESALELVISEASDQIVLEERPTSPSTPFEESVSVHDKLLN